MGDEVDGFVVPHLQSWFRQNSFLCTPDNGLLYYSRSDVNYVPPLAKGQMPQVKVFSNKASIKSMACSSDWNEKREFAILDDHNVLCIWDMDKEAPVKGHKGHFLKRQHTRDKDVCSAICFSQTEKVISVDYSELIVYCLLTDTFKVYPDFFKQSMTVVILSPSPHDRYIFAAGTRSGLVLLFSIKDMTILYTMRGHDKEIVSIDWMQVPVIPEDCSASWRREERPKIEARKKKERDSDENPPQVENPPAEAAVADASDIFDIYDYNENEEEFGTIIDRETSSYNKRDRFRDKIHTTEGFNFLEACQSLKQDIIEAQKQENEEDDDALGDESRPLINTDDENELDDAEKLRDYIIVDDEGKEKQESAESNKSQNELARLIMVTGSREQSIYFWDVESGVAIDRVFNQTSSSFKKMSPSTFITVAWINPEKIVANNQSGHVFEWKVNFRFRATRVRMTSKMNSVRYPVDGIVSVVRAKGSIASNDPNKEYLWCLSMNRKILALSIKDRPEVIVDLTSMASGNMVIQENPHESTVLAVGCTDKKLITLNLASMTSTNVNCVPFMNKVVSKVSALDWHPEKENVIAFGTAEGRIGLMDTNSPNNVPVLMKPPFLNSEVYALKWCMLTEANNIKSLVLFASGKKHIAYFRMMGFNIHEPNELKQFGMVSDVTAYGRYLFVGSQDGSFTISDLDNNLAKLYHMNVARRYICSMQYKNDILAVASNGVNIHLVDFSNGMDDQVTENITSLEGHTEGVCTVRWGNGDSKLLVSSSFDSTVRVWDTTSASCIAVYNSTDSVFCAIFSPIHENVIIFSGKGTTLSFIDYTKHLASENSSTKKTKVPVKWAVDESATNNKLARERKKMQKSVDKHLSKAVEAFRISDSTPGNSPTVSTERINGALPDHLENGIETQADKLEADSSLQSLSDRLQHMKVKENVPPNVQLNASYQTVFHLTKRELNKASRILRCITSLAKYTEPLEEAEEQKEAQAAEQDQTKPNAEALYLNEKLFRSEKELRELIHEETLNHRHSTSSSIGTVLLPQINFQLKEVIIERIASGTLTDQLLSLTPSVSYEFWRKSCEAYAYQILGNRGALASVPYFIACHKIDESIDTLCKHKFFREAWAIAKLRKADDDPIREQVCTEWAQYLESVGNMEGAALIWTAVKKYKNAIAILSKRKEISEEIQATIDALNAKLHESLPVA
ncbi:protein rigor mortis [Uranotaenia lowii]|uniref:protein rigor mortis n=1 Tax=Uranotaenia lowii TaxID=190385 RepID=UPI0024792389|nr:protein rigor mortis [Uranotaenia lowii]